MCTSVASEGKIAVKPEDGLSPEENERGLMQALDAVIDQCNCVPKRTVRVSIEKMYLRFGCLNSSGILVLAFVVAEEQLTRCSTVSILPR